MLAPDMALRTVGEGSAGAFRSPTVTRVSGASPPLFQGSEIFGNKGLPVKFGYCGLSGICLSSYIFPTQLGDAARAGTFSPAKS